MKRSRLYWVVYAQVHHSTYAFLGRSKKSANNINVFLFEIKPMPEIVAASIKIAEGKSWDISRTNFLFFPNIVLLIFFGCYKPL
jgi:hypothetical protein